MVVRGKQGCAETEAHSAPGHALDDLVFVIVGFLDHESVHGSDLLWVVGRGLRRHPVGADDRAHGIRTPRFDALDAFIRVDAKHLALVGLDRLGRAADDGHADDAVAVADRTGPVCLAGFELGGHGRVLRWRVVYDWNMPYVDL